MRPVSDAFLRTVKQSHTVVTRAILTLSYQTTESPIGVEVPIIDGNVQLDGSADVRASLDLTIRPDWWPSGPDDLITPYGNEIFIQRGVEIVGQAPEWVSLGYFRIDTVEQSDAPRGAVRVTAQDRMAGLIEAHLLSPRQFAATATIASVYDSLVKEIYPSATISYDFTSTDTIDRTIVVESDRFGALKDLTRSLGKVMYWDHQGALQVVSMPDESVPVFEVAAGSGGVLITHNRAVSRDGIYNATVVQGSAPDDKAPVVAIARDMNPKSRTYWNGRFGKVPREPYVSEWIVRKSQAEATAKALLRQSLGLPYVVDFTLVPNPALEPWDPVAVRYEDGQAELHTISTLNVPLVESAAMAATTRDQTNVEIDVE